ncbi:hypothetical protein BKA15_004077 [Microlunatus parietis]|uniref:Uncharacterized protein n=1 Tax=Microlunatus parietis TaxID=682979 RepID=A0A7Y9LDC2_9ACTN|nr:hypothetical protein [Microlunatus parietis]
MTCADDRRVRRAVEAGLIPLIMSLVAPGETICAAD